MLARSCKPLCYASCRRRADADDTPDTLHAARDLPAPRPALREPPPDRRSNVSQCGAACRSVGPVIRKLHVDAEIRFAKQLDHGLKCVTIASGDTHEIA